MPERFVILTGESAGQCWTNITSSVHGSLIMINSDWVWRVSAFCRHQNTQIFSFLKSPLKTFFYKSFLLMIVLLFSLILFLGILFHIIFALFLITLFYFTRCINEKRSNLGSTTRVCFEKRFMNKGYYTFITEDVFCINCCFSLIHNSNGIILISKTCYHTK